VGFQKRNDFELIRYSLPRMDIQGENSIRQLDRVTIQPLMKLSHSRPHPCMVSFYWV